MRDGLFMLPWFRQLAKCRRHWATRRADFAAASKPSRSPTRHPTCRRRELERRLIELGFTEGATIEILHEGAFGRDPIAVRVNDATVALRRREAMAILVI